MKNLIYTGIGPVIGEKNDNKAPIEIVDDFLESMSIGFEEKHNCINFDECCVVDKYRGHYTRRIWYH